MTKPEDTVMRIIRLPEVMSNTGLSRSSIYRFMGDGHFPKHVSLGGRSVGWIDREVADWVMARIEHRDEGNDPLISSHH